jgi:putative FmdB family regulatory protein
MPIYEYRPGSERHCDFCVAGFDVLQKISDAPVSQCPHCAAPVERHISAPHLAKGGPSLQESNLEKHGFTQYRKVEKGVYEKTVGKGPDFISDD